MLVATTVAAAVAGVGDALSEPGLGVAAEGVTALLATVGDAGTGPGVAVANV
ncbi:MAG TPA: hypothetical protein VFA70_12495 [Dehalococcoidia bacterium]|nr:hypothetical protein [Dehalococcoidia bacterium]